MSVATKIKERPMLFSGPMVQAILEDRKWHTRRVIKPQPPVFAGNWYQRNLDHVWYNPENPDLWHFVSPSGKENHIKPICCPYGKPGDRLWVRETWCCVHSIPYAPGPDPRDLVHYRADQTEAAAIITEHRCWRPSIHMPRAYSRITLEITGVRVDRLQMIGPVDCKAEGIQKDLMTGTSIQLINDFEKLWDSINGKTYPWKSNPWVWVIEFKRVAE